MAKDRKSGMPEWLGNYPAGADKSNVVVLKRSDEQSLVYGRGGNLDVTPVFVSTNKLQFFGEYTVPPGGHFEPADVHPGDECYYCLEGHANIFDPVHGDVVELGPGDALLIPKGTWHMGFNFGEVNFRLLAAAAPKIWSEDEMGLDVDFKDRPSFYED